MRLRFILGLIGLPVALASAQSFVNFESPHVHPMDITPDGATLLVVNTADYRLEVFDIASGIPSPIGSIPVGIEPVSVRARSNTLAWVVNHISDSVNIVNLTTMNVVATIATGDEPCDVVFAGTTTRAFVSVSQRNEIRVYDPDSLALISTLTPSGEDPRALATDGASVYAAVHDSGNKTTILSQPVVSSAVNPYPGDPNPPPNSGAGFSPSIDPNLPTPPAVSLIVKKQPDGTWRDDNGGDWSAAVTWDLHDRDVVIIDADTLGISYATGLMNHNMALAPHPSGDVTVVGTDAINHVRFEPNVNGIFVRVNMATFDPAAPATPAIVDLNPHLTYASPTIPEPQREAAIGDPRAIVWSADGVRGWVAGMGSNNVIEIDTSGARVNRIDVGQGPTGLALSAAGDRLYVLNRFDGTISVIDTTTNLELVQVTFFDPTPLTIKLGRPHLYDTHVTSGLGHLACASCHVDARMDNLVWDLGNPQGQVKAFNQICNGGAGGCEDWHPMKGPMATQTLVAMIGTEPLHWRGDRDDLAEFNGAFESLLGDDAQLTTQEMDEFNDFLATIKIPPNPFRNFDNSLPTTFPNGGDALNGQTLFNSANLDGGVVDCADCHTPPSGTNRQIISGPVLTETQSVKVPQLRNLYDKTGFDHSSMSNNRGFGFIHDGSIDTLQEFLNFRGFTFPSGPTGDQQRLDMEAYLFAFSRTTHAAVGVQTTLIDGANPAPGQLTLINNMITEADDSTVGLIVKGVQGGLQRGYKYIGGNTFQSDRAAEQISRTALVAAAAPGSELTFTVVPLGLQNRLGVDRDEDSYYDRDETDACSDPADASSIPDLTDCNNNMTPDACDIRYGTSADENGNGVPDECEPCPGDTNGDQVVDNADLQAVLDAWASMTGDPNYNPDADLNDDGQVENADLQAILDNWAKTCL